MFHKTVKSDDCALLARLKKYDLRKANLLFRKKAFCLVLNWESEPEQTQTFDCVNSSTQLQKCQTSFDSVLIFFQIFHLMWSQRIPVMK